MNSSQLGEGVVSMEDRRLLETVIIRKTWDFQEGEISEAVTLRSRP